VHTNFFSHPFYNITPVSFVCLFHRWFGHTIVGRKLQPSLLPIFLCTQQHIQFTCFIGFVGRNISSMRQKMMRNNEVLVVVSYFLVDRKSIRIHQKRGGTSDWPSSQQCCFPLSLSTILQRLQAFHNKFSHYFFLSYCLIHRNRISKQQKRIQASNTVILQAVQTKFCSVLVSIQLQAAELLVSTLLHLLQSLSPIFDSIIMDHSCFSAPILLQFYPMWYDRSCSHQNWVPEGVPGLLAVALHNS
jgi:hypothetical protein